MKYIKTYESIGTNEYLVIKHSTFMKDNNNICLLKTNDDFLLNNKIYVNIIAPIVSSTHYYVDLTEIYENTYEDEFGFTFEILYKSKNINDAKEMFSVYSNINKYNL
jgi:hypothetical protein